MTWKAGPEKPRMKFCWECGRPFHGRVHASIRLGGDGIGVDVHKACLAKLKNAGHHVVVVYESSTAKPGATP